MLIYKGYKYRIYPTGKQKHDLDQTFGCCRFVFNHFLDVRKTAWETNKKTVTYTQTSALLTALKHNPEHLWLNDCDSMALQESLRDLDRGYKNFFDRISEYPKFKKKYAHIQSYRTRNQSNGLRFVDNKHIHLPVIGNIKTRVSRFPVGRILNATVTKTAGNKYFVSLCVEEELIPKSNDGCMVGIDVGLKNFYTDSNGNSVYAPKPLRVLEKRLIREQRRLSRMLEANTLKRDSKGRPVYKRPLSECGNLQKQRIKVACIHEKITNIRNDFLHKEALKLVNENQVICIEHLNVKGMTKNHKLSKAINDVSWSRFFTLLEYKAFEHGCDIVKVPAFYPSSQTCSVCGYKNPEVKNLKVRQWVCPCCNSSHGRDHNAAVNILAKGLESLNAS